MDDFGSTTEGVLAGITKVNGQVEVGEVSEKSCMALIARGKCKKSGNLCGKAGHMRPWPERELAGTTPLCREREK
jgi:hypothetical protein